MNNQETIEAQVMDDFSPLDAPVKQRSYTQHKIYADSDVIPELEEPTFQAPNLVILTRQLQKKKNQQNLLMKRIAN